MNTFASFLVVGDVALGSVQTVKKRLILAGNSLLALAFTLILAGYLMVWLPQPVAGLSFIGLEMGEWVKFLPQVRTGPVLLDRNLFYLPPISLGIMLALWTAGWPNSRWKTWAARGLAVAVSLLAFPAIEALRFEPASEWLQRIILIGLALTAVLLASASARWFGEWFDSAVCLIFVLLGLMGALLPTWAYLAVRPAISALFDSQIGIGAGLWLNLAGHLLVVIVAVVDLSANGQRFVNVPPEV